jgi:antirestriction protein ArdC
VHATGHEQRLNRSSITESKGYGSEPYGKEELVAELGSAFLCGHAGIVDQTINSSAAYLEGWLKQLQQDRTLIVHAAAQAQRAVDFILGKEPEEVIPQDTEVAPPPPQVAEVCA